MKADSLATRHQPLATDPSPLSSLPSPLFTVRTPTSVVTDLGTEFGVEVNESGDTTSHVFQGTVLVQAGIREIGDKEKKRPATAVAGGQSDHSVTLVAGQTLCVGTVHETHQDSVADALVRFTQPAAPPQFARRIYTPPKVLDLLDIVAGGDGRGNRRERGIDPTSGCEDPVFIAETRRGDGVYRPVPWHRLIDGVVVPERHADRMQLDSAEHVFEGMHKNTGIAGLTYGSIWARAAEIAQPRLADEVAYWVYSSAFDEKFSPEKRGMLCLHASAGITFDLEAMRKMYKETRPARFRAVVGLADVRRVLPSARAAADVWVFIDGRMVFERPDLRWKDGAIPVDVPLGKSDRFLTLASTDSGSGHAYDNVVFGDPVLEMASTVSENLKEGLPMDR
ncbi:MAG: hypothetical protein GX594_01910 [Pirellulaceae bacterium]|nr:hypothetical protein [Pirellulaceae bacterium]